MSQVKIITKFARMWPRQFFEGPKRPPWADGIWKELDFPGVYVLYRDEHAYYVGQTKTRLYGRIWFHANRPQTRHFNFWNFVSAFVVPAPRHVDQVEALLITTMTTANRATPKIRRITFPLRAWKHIRGDKRSASLP
jgi:hypothetical protein